MSTRGCVAIAFPRGHWKGVYNHSDSYPTWLGKKLWAYLHRDHVELEGFAEILLHYDDWRNFLNGGRCEYCGQVGMGQPHNISGALFIPDIPERFPDEAAMRAYFQRLPAWAGRDADIEREVQAAAAIAKARQETGYPDPEAKHHEHGKLTDKITSEAPNPLFIEWVYVVDVEKRTITVLAHQDDGKTEGRVRLGGPTRRHDGYWDYGHCAFRHIKVAEVSLDGPEPDWDTLERFDEAA